MVQIYFVRHGQTEWNLIRKFQGQTDIPLNEVGRQQARLAAQQLGEKNFDVMYSSDLSRAAETADIINACHNLDIVRDARLRERCFGKFEGHTIAETREKYPELRKGYEEDKLNFKIPGGESRLEFIRRVGGMLDDIHRNHDGQTVAVVSHGGVLGSMVSHIVSQKLNFDSPQFVPLFSIKNCSISQLEFSNGQWLIQSLNETHHLNALAQDSMAEDNA